MEAGLLVDQPLPRELHHLFRHARLVEFDVTLEQFQPVLLVTGLESSHANRCFARALHVSIFLLPYRSTLLAQAYSQLNYPPPSNRISAQRQLCDIERRSANLLGSSARQWVADVSRLPVYSDRRAKAGSSGESECV